MGAAGAMPAAEGTMLVLVVAMVGMEEAVTVVLLSASAMVGCSRRRAAVAWGCCTGPSKALKATGRWGRGAVGGRGSGQDCPASIARQAVNFHPRLPPGPTATTTTSSS